MTYELGIIGAGNMAEAIVRGVTAKGVFRAGQIIAADVSPARRELFENQLGVRAVEGNAEATRDSRVVLLSVKPQQMADALGGIGAAMADQSLVISIMAGVTAATIEKHLGGGKRWRVIRTMPNTPMLVGEGVVGISPGTHATAEDLRAARRIFEAAADVVEVPADKMDAVTALSGSGPAYVFFLVEQMIRAGVEMGLTHDQASLLARKTAFGAAKMLVAAPHDAPEELRRRVTSPGGTTQAAITHMEQRDLPRIVVDAVKAAERRGKELGQ